MPLSIRDYAVRLRAIYEQVDARSNPDGHVPIVSTQEWAELLDYAFQVVPDLEQHWREVGTWVSEMMALLDAYHTLAGQLLEEEETAKLPAFPEQDRQGLLDYAANDGID